MREELLAGVKITLAVVGGGMAAWFGGVWPMLFLTFVFLVFDYITGMLAAGSKGELESRKGRRGIFRKVATLLLLCLGLALDAAIPFFASRGLDLELGIRLPFGLIICAWIIINESISILENLIQCGVQVPGFLGKLLQVTAGQLDSRGK